MKNWIINHQRVLIFAAIFATVGLVRFIPPYEPIFIGQRFIEAVAQVIHGFANLLDKFGFDILLVHAIDRLARDPFHRQVLEREINARGARVEYVLGNYDESPEGEVRKDLDATFAKWENAKRLERVNRGKKRKAEMGKFVGGKTSYGYIINRDTPSGLEIYEPEAGVVQLIFKWYVEDGLSIYQIVRELEEREIETRTGNPRWRASMVAQLLKNTAYVGYVYYNKKS